jgi:N-acetyl-anhydromuramyl-L-alanine amidase AmpD
MIKFGDKSAEVAEVQKLLSLLGYDLIVDSSFGPKTLRSIKAFQKKYGIPQDGIVNDKTLTTLKAAQKKTSKEDLTQLQAINYNGLEIRTDCQMPENQYVKQITSKSQIFIHFTAGRPSAEGTINGWNSDEPRVATAYVIDGNTGTIVQAFNPDYWGFHLGIKGTNGKLDRISIGIEICAFGPLIKRGNDFFAWPNDYTTKVDTKNVYILDQPFRGYKYYFNYTDEQLKNLESLLRFLIKKYSIKVQKNFDKSWLEYNQDVINKSLPGIWSHSTVRKDKFDTYPDTRLFEILNRISKEFN